MSLRELVLATHRWMGLSASVVLSVVGLTGLVFFLPTAPWVARASGRLHESLALGRVGAWIVLLATACAVVLQAGGLYLWWKRKAVKVHLRAGWRRALFDLHHLVGVTGFALMLVLAATGVSLALVGPQDQPWLRKVSTDLHTAKFYPWPIKALYGFATFGFVAQAITGVAMWWRPSKRR